MHIAHLVNDDLQIAKYSQIHHNNFQINPPPKFSFHVIIKYRHEPS